MKSLCLSLALALAAPAAALSSDSDFAASVGEITGDMNTRMKSLMSMRLSLMTQQSGPNDPILLAQKPLIDMIKRVESSVVFLRMDNGNGTCTGFFTDFSATPSKKRVPTNIITTNAHCVEHLAVGAELEVGLYTGDDNRPRMTKGKVLAYGNSDIAKDIAFVELLDPTLKRNGLPLWSKLARGEQVIAIGNPLGMTFSISRGIVSALQRAIVGESFVLDMNQSDVAVNPGNSGGPLFNMWGSVVGINSVIVSESGGFEGISFSVPSSYITLAMRQFKRTGDLKVGAMQVELSQSATTKKLMVHKVVKGGAAEAANMQKDDEIIAVDGISLAAGASETAMKDFVVYVKYRSPGETVAVTVRRGGQDVVLQVKLGTAKPPAPPRPEWAPIPKKQLHPVIASL